LGISENFSLVCVQEFFVEFRRHKLSQRSRHALARYPQHQRGRDDNQRTELVTVSRLLQELDEMLLFVQNAMLAAPTTHFVLLSQGILYRGAGLETVWPQFAALSITGAVFFMVAQRRLRKTISTMA